MFSLQQNLRKRGSRKQPGDGGWGRGRNGEVVQTMYTHVSKDKNDKIKF
jgi:hypothetical protein